ncbi:MAG: InlB B-repeat-containing protein [Acholeplasmatales bacterium]|jgi:glycosidase|nr:InlB B-repeat-containing protein [Acholeplasmatales bacterium]
MKKFLTLLIFSLTIFLLFAACSKIQIIYYSVSFDANGGIGNLDPLRVEEGQKIKYPSATQSLFHPQNLIFNGWSLDINGQKMWNFKYDIVESDLTLYATWIDESNYMNSVASWATSGYLYLHYLRYENNIDDYNQWNLWIWAFAPLRYEGITAEFERFDSTGAIAGIDLNRSYNNAGWHNDGSGPDNLYADFYQTEIIGFLIVFKESKSKSVGMWQSDGGNTYVSGIQVALDEWGSVHIFCKQDIVGDYTISAPNNAISENPYENLDDHQGNSNYLANQQMPGLSNPNELISDGAYTYVNSSLDNSSLKTTTSDEFFGVGYQIQVSSFSDSNGDGFGDIKGITNNLNYLEDLGVKVLWLTPVQLANNYHGYDVIDFYEIDPRFGTKADYEELLQQAHHKGMKVLMDLVINHTANNSRWFKDSALFKEITVTDKNGLTYSAPARSLFTWRDDPTSTTDNTGTPIWYPYSTYGYYYYSSFSSNMPELNYDYQPTRDAIINVAEYWLNFGLDGFRLDAVKHVYTSLEVQSPQTGDTFAGEMGNRYEANVTKNNNFFNEFSARLKSIKQECFIVGENFDGNNDNIAPYVKSIDSQFSFPALYSLSSQFDSPNPNGDYYQSGYYQFKNNRLSGTPEGSVFIDSPFTSNHDVIRAINFVSGAPSGFYGSKNIKAVNRDYYEARAKLWASIIITLPGLPWIFYGDELGMTSNLYPNEYGNAESFMDRYYRQPFKWEYGKTPTTTSFYVEAWLVNWDPYNATLFGVKEQSLLPNSVLNHYKDLIHLKNELLAINRGDIYMWNNATPGVLVYERRYLSSRVLVYHNMNNYPIANYQFSGENYRGSAQYLQSGSSITSLGAYQSAIFIL